MWDLRRTVVAVRAALAGGLVLLGLVVVGVLSSSPARLAGASAVALQGKVEELHGGELFCQQG
jgi:hypothetical protein